MKPKPKPDLRPIREKALRELVGPAWADPDYPSAMVQRIRALGGVPIRDFTNEDLRLVIGQQRGLRYLVPLALERLEHNPLAEGALYRGDLLMALTHADDVFWQEHPEWRVRLRSVLERALERLAAVPPYDPQAFGMTNPDEPDAVDRESLEPRLQQSLPRFL